MRKLLFVLLMLPFCCTITVGCGGSGENTVIEPAESVDLEEEGAQIEEEMDTPEE